jgi:hypothetical protein
MTCLSDLSEAPERSDGSIFKDMAPLTGLTKRTGMGTDFTGMVFFSLLTSY